MDISIFGNWKINLNLKVEDMAHKVSPYKHPTTVWSEYYKLVSEPLKYK